jgi:hypothetical protein
VIRVFLSASPDGGVDTMAAIPAPDFGRSRGYVRPDGALHGLSAAELRELRWIDLDDNGVVTHREPLPLAYRRSKSGQARIL